jgi:hypothetical protein
MHLVAPGPATPLGEPTALRSRRIAGYDRIAADALAKACWPTADDFRGYRFEADYPPAPCEVNMICAINER